MGGKVVPEGVEDGLGKTASFISKCVLEEKKEEGYVNEDWVVLNVQCSSYMVLTV
jgi:hypothetical protein